MCIRIWKRSLAERDFLISQVLARHTAWFPAHNRGRQAPPEALASWKRTVQRLPDRELIRLLADNRARNRLLGKTWPRDDGSGAG